jgi:hypothetical protein
MASTQEGRLVITWRRLESGAPETPAGFDWSVSQLEDTRLTDDEIEALLSEIVAQI